MIAMRPSCRPWDCRRTSRCRLHLRVRAARVEPFRDRPWSGMRLQQQSALIAHPITSSNRCVQNHRVSDSQQTVGLGDSCSAERSVRVVDAARARVIEFAFLRSRARPRPSTRLDERSRVMDRLISVHCGRSTNKPTESVTGYSGAGKSGNVRLRIHPAMAWHSGASGGNRPCSARKPT